MKRKEKGEVAKRVSAQERIGERRKMNGGKYATILEITGKASDGRALFKVQFEDGAVVDGVKYGNFERGNVQHPKDKVVQQDRIGEHKKMNNGMYATILEITGRYRTNALYKVNFEDGTVRDGITYNSFKRGKVAHPNDNRVPAQERISERRRMNNGQYATILEMSGRDSGGSALFKIQFEDGEMVDGVKYNSFKQGSVAHPRDKKVPVRERIGERRKMNSGLYATILEITGRDSHKEALFKVQFEDGTVVDGVRYGQFKKGHVAHPNDKITAQDRAGERKKMNNGMYATILEITRRSGTTALYKIQFEDGAVRDGVTYDSFKKGQVAHPKDKASGKIGERRKMNNGLWATILEISGKDSGGKTLFKVSFEDGAIRDGVTYSHFQKGQVAHPKNKATGKIGERRKMNNGLYATILESSGKNGNTALYVVQFEDGAVVDGVQHSHFKQGNVAHPSYRPDAPLGEREIAQALINVGIPFVWEYTADWLKDNGRSRSMDFFLPDLNLFIEFHGQQHFEYIPHFHDTGRDGRKGLPAFWQEKAIDDFKWKACHEHGCDVWYFADDEPYTEDYRYPVHKLGELVDMLHDRMAG